MKILAVSHAYSQLSRSITLILCKINKKLEMLRNTDCDPDVTFARTSDLFTLLMLSTTVKSKSFYMLYYLFNYKIYGR